MTKKAVVGMSGGVDSSVAALLLLRDGYEVHGVTLKLKSQYIDDESGCCTEQDIADAEDVCRTLGIQHHVLEFTDEFKSNVINHFCESYICGNTPNPCVQCNRTVKFPQLFKAAEKLSCDFAATGHYASIEYNTDLKKWLLKKGHDHSKDQSYVLYNLTQKQLSSLLFPVGTLSKADVRKLAEENGLVNQNKPDSMDICFIPNGDYAGFISHIYGYQNTPGNFVDINGKILGKHKGLIHYTTGQRKGLGVSADRPLYVISKDLKNNTVLLGDNADLFSSELTADSVNLIMADSLTEPVKLTAKIRYSQTSAPCTVFPVENGVMKVAFDSPQRAVTSGQSVVLYDGDYVFGGGIII